MISKALNLAKDTSRVDEVFIVSEVAEAFYESYKNLNPPRVNLCRIVQASKILQQGVNIMRSVFVDLK